MLAAEYPRLALVAAEGDVIGHKTCTHDCTGFGVTMDGGDAVFATALPRDFSSTCD